MLEDTRSTPSNQKRRRLNSSGNLRRYGLQPTSEGMHVEAVIYFEETSLTSRQMSFPIACQKFGRRKRSGMNGFGGVA